MAMEMMVIYDNDGGEKKTIYKDEGDKKLYIIYRRILSLVLKLFGKNCLSA